MARRRNAPARRWGASLLGAAWIAAVAGCTGEPVRDAEVVTGIEHEDIPVPTRFELRDSEAFRPSGVDDPAFRSWIAHYRGVTRVGELAPFYVRSMPRHGWELQEIRDDADEGRILFFHKADETASIRLYREYDRKIGGMATIVEASIRPRSLESFDVESYFGIGAEGGKRREGRARKAGGNGGAATPATGAEAGAGPEAGAREPSEEAPRGSSSGSRREASDSPETAVAVDGSRSGDRR